MKYLNSAQSNPVVTVDISRKLWPDEHLEADPDTGAPIVVNRGDVDVDALIQAGRSQTLDLNELMQEDPLTAEAWRQPYGVSDEVIDTTAAASLKESLNSVREATVAAKAAGFDSIEAYVQDLVNKEIAKQKAAAEPAGKEAE